MAGWFFSTKKMTVGYDGVPVISDIEIELERGRILVLIGPNGAGKSTIIKSITGQLSLIAGTVSLGEVSLNEMSAGDRAKRLAVVLTQRVRPELMTVREVVEMGRYPYTGRLGILSDEDKRAVDRVLGLTGVAEFSERDVTTLSDGQMQRVMLAKALAQEPQILVLDEPTSFLDIHYQMGFLEILRELSRKEQLTVIMSMHDLDMAEWVADMVLCVKGEYVERFGRPEDVFSLDYISSFYGISKEELTSLGQWRVR